MSKRMGNDNEELHELIKRRIEEIATSISQYRGLAFHRPEPWARASHCFANVGRKVAQDGGGIAYGWTFHHRFADAIPGPGYLYLTHHAVWHEPPGRLVNITPYPETRHNPLPGPDQDIFFVVDKTAKPVVTGNRVSPLPLKYMALDESDEVMAAYIKKLNEEEQKKCKQLHEVAT